MSPCPPCFAMWISMSSAWLAAEEEREVLAVKARSHRSSRSPRWLWLLLVPAPSLPLPPAPAPAPERAPDSHGLGEEL